MEKYSHPDIHDILEVEGNGVCVDCGGKPKWASMNNGVFLCLKCAGTHRCFGMSISLIRSLELDSWTENQLLYLTKGGNKNFLKNLQEFNIDPSTASVDVKYKSKAADYYRRYLKNEVDRESDSNYVPTQIIKPDLSVAQEIVEIKEEEKKEESKEEGKKEEKKGYNKFLGFMSSVFTKVKEGTSSAAKTVEKGFTDLKLGEKFKVAGTAIADAAKTSGNFIADKTQKAVHSEFVQNISKKTKDGVNTIVTRTKSMVQKEKKQNENEENKPEAQKEGTENKEEKKEENNEEKKEENKEENKDKKKEENKEGENTSAQENSLPENNPVSEEKVETAPEQNLDANTEENNQNN